MKTPPPNKPAHNLFDYAQQPSGWPICAGDKWHKVGNVMLREGNEIVCVAVNDCSARFVELKNRGGIVTLAPSCHKGESIHRMTEKELLEFLTNGRSGSRSTNNNNEGESMAKKVKKEKGAKAEYVSLVGRSDYVRKLKADGMKWDAAWEKILSKYPGSSVSKCKAVWESKPKTAKAEKKPKAPAGKKPKAPPVKKAKAPADKKVIKLPPPKKAAEQTEEEKAESITSGEQVAS